MTVEKNRFDFAVERAKRIYEERVVPELGDSLDGQWIVIDADSGDYEVDEDFVNAVETIEARKPDIEGVYVRDGEFIAGHLGGYAQALWTSMSEEAQNSVPHDGSLNYKHYLYGFPKRDRYYWEE